MLSIAVEYDPNAITRICFNDLIGAFHAVKSDPARTVISTGVLKRKVTYCSIKCAPDAG